MFTQLDPASLALARRSVGILSLFAALLFAATALAAPPHQKTPTMGASAVRAGGNDKPAAKQPVPPDRGARSSTVTGVLNLNEATEAQLQLLPGIGKVKAERIVAWRGKHGRFRRVKDLRRVKGFGAKSVAKLTPYLRVDGQSTLARAR